MERQSNNQPMASLYVGSLCSSITEAMLFDKFSAVGPIISIRLCRDFVTFQPLGYAYVNFKSHADAEKALKSVNFDLMHEQPIRIMWSQRDASVRKSGVGNVIIKNLDKSFDNKILYHTFSALGNIISCKVVEDGDGNSKTGFVNFDTEEASRNAILTMNGTIQKGKTIFVGQFIPRQRKERELPNNIFVKNIYQLSEECLKGMFCKFGDITSVKIVYREGKQGSGFGFVNFQNRESAEKAITDLNGIDINGKAIYVGWAEKKEEKQQRLKILHEKIKLEHNSQYHVFIKNLDNSVDENQLLKEFSCFGMITGAHIMSDNNQVSKGFGFVSFRFPEDARRAIYNMNGSIIAGKALYVAPAKIKDGRQIGSSVDENQIMTSMNSQKLNSHFARTHLPTNTRPILNKRATQIVSPFGPQKFCYKYTNSMRNPPDKLSEISAKVMEKDPQQVILVQGQEPVTTLMLVEATHSGQKQILGERLFPLIYQMFPDQANKITGMLLELDNDELIHLLEDGNALKSTVEEAFAILSEYQKQISNIISNHLK